MINVTVADFETVYKVWSEYLWPDRKTEIQPHSAMLISGEYELKNFGYPPTFFVLYLDGQLVGCNSGHKCCDNSYRSRGLYVFPEYRKRGIGKALLLATIEQGKKENSNFVWSYPRLESWPTYLSAGFSLASDWAESETGINAFCKHP
jgi:GNAT superfamily N-acetyltransferase